MGQRGDHAPHVWFADLQAVERRHEEVPASTLWFFILAILGSGGQVIYSWLLDNWVFLIVNVCLIANNLLGLGILAYRWRVTRKPSPHAMQPVPQG